MNIMNISHIYTTHKDNFENIKCSNKGKDTDKESDLSHDHTFVSMDRHGQLEHITLW